MTLKVTDNQYDRLS